MNVATPSLPGCAKQSGCQGGPPWIVSESSVRMVAPTVIIAEPHDSGMEQRWSQWLALFATGMAHAKSLLPKREETLMSPRGKAPRGERRGRESTVGCARLSIARSTAVFARYDFASTT
jgi:hypothetical protein